MPLLASAAALCHAHGALEGCPEVLELISAFLDHSGRWTLRSAGAAGHEHLLRRLVQSMPTALLPMADDAEAEHLVPGFLQEAVARDRLGLLRWWLELLPELVVPELLEWTAAQGRKSIAKWLWEHRGEDYEDAEPCLDHAAVGGHWEMVRWLHDVCGEPYSTTTLDLAAEFGQLEIVVELIQEHKIACTGPGIIAKTAAAGHLPVLDWLREHQPQLELTPAAMDGAATNGQLLVVQWLHEHHADVGCTEAAINGAVKHRHLEVVEFLLAHGYSAFSPSLIRAREVVGDLERLQFVHERLGLAYTKDTMNMAATMGHLDVVQYLHAHSPVGCGMDAMSGAALCGHVEVVQWLHAHRTEGCSPGGIVAAAAQGRLEMVRWLVEHYGDRLQRGRATRLMDEIVDRKGDLALLLHLHKTRGFVCSVASIEPAAVRGETALLMWLREIGVGSMTRSTVELAARHGHLEAVQWLHSRCGVQPDEDVLWYAAHYGHLTVAEYLVNIAGVVVQDETIREALSYGHHDVAMFLLTAREGRPLDPTLCDVAARNGNLQMLLWFHERGIVEGFTPSTMDQAAAGGHVDIIQWLHETRQERCTSRALEHAASVGYVDVIAYLLDHAVPGAEPTEAMFQAATQRGHREIIKWLHVRFPDRDLRV